jgi:hypothetical protein
MSILSYRMSPYWRLHSHPEIDKICKTRISISFSDQIDPIPANVNRKAISAIPVGLKCETQYSY